MGQVVTSSRRERGITALFLLHCQQANCRVAFSALPSAAPLAPAVQPSEDRYDEAQDKERAHRKFITLDTSGDDKLNADELRVAFEDLHPNESRYARLQSNHMLDMADTNRDRQLTLEEALENAHAFYAVTEPEPDYSYHDEL